MSYHRILTVQDLSCLGQVSAAVALPVLSACGQEVCLLPTALLSTHTGFPEPYIQKLTDAVPAIVRHWQREKITFDAILVGYLGSVEMIFRVLELADSLLIPGGMLIVDPVMADNGKLYRGYDMTYVEAMRKLCARADVLLPNVTEAALLADIPYPKTLSEDTAVELLSGISTRQAVLTGALEEKNRTGIAVKQGNKITFHRHHRAPGSFHGTGDLFAATLTGTLMQGRSLPDAAAFAADFTGRCALETSMHPAHSYGIRFEPLLGLLTKESGERNESETE